LGNDSENIPENNMEVKRCLEKELVHKDGLGVLLESVGERGVRRGSSSLSTSVIKLWL